MTTLNPLPYVLRPIENARPSADGRCAGCGEMQALSTMQRDENAGQFTGNYCNDCAAEKGGER